MRRYRGFLLGLVILFIALPVLGAAESLQDILARMTDEELLQLNEMVCEEMELRGLSVSSQLMRSSKAAEPLVWVPKSGSKYHKTESCSGMKSPSQIELSIAKHLGYTPCKRCKPPN